jgi:cellulose synthase/poly-beta-1,6-N-acetylglucosamine synthase-like glycosyltransferase
MMLITSVLFWVFAGLIIYIYIGYPLIVWLLAQMKHRQIRKAPFLPTVTIVIPAYNEEEHIRETLINKLRLDYPKEKMEIIVVSDHSTDQTDEIIKEYLSSGVRLIRQESRGGKTSALNKAVGEAAGEIIVFSDGNSLYEKDALKHLVANFSDKSVGYVTGRMAYFSPDTNMISEGCSTYMKYENFLRRSETKIGSVIGVNGGIDAVRKCLYIQMRPEQQSDLVLPLKVIEQGYRVVFEPEAILKEDALIRSGDEYRMRVRVTVRALNAVKDMKHLLNPLRYGMLSWQLFSHKILRYGANIPFMGLLATNLFLLGEGVIYQFAILSQTIFYALAILGWYFDRRGYRLVAVYAPLYLCLLNIATLHAFWKMIRGESQVIWNPRGG